MVFDNALLRGAGITYVPATEEDLVRVVLLGGGGGVEVPTRVKANVGMQAELIEGLRSFWRLRKEPATEESVTEKEN
ncbi:uncharacterized protein A4U43_C08F21920 [Asparagus officinalis]|nr:uncharacterized protein A4U43_C08F21920 [Asparagus officinalis]